MHRSTPSRTAVGILTAVAILTTATLSASHASLGGFLGQSLWDPIAHFFGWEQAGSSMSAAVPTDMAPAQNQMNAANPSGPYAPMMMPGQTPYPPQQQPVVQPTQTPPPGMTADQMMQRRQQMSAPTTPGAMTPPPGMTQDQIDRMMEMNGGQPMPPGSQPAQASDCKGDYNLCSDGGRTDCDGDAKVSNHPCNNFAGFCYLCPRGATSGESSGNSGSPPDGHSGPPASGYCGDGICQSNETADRLRAMMTCDPAPDAPCPPRPVYCPQDCSQASSSSSSSGPSCVLDHEVSNPLIADDGSVVYMGAPPADPSHLTAILRGPDGTRTALGGPGTGGPALSRPLAYSRDGRNVLLLGADNEYDFEYGKTTIILYDTAKNTYAPLMQGSVYDGDYSMSDDGRSVVYLHTKPELKKDAEGRGFNASCVLRYDVATSATSVLSGSDDASCLADAKNPDAASPPILGEDQAGSALISRDGNAVAIVLSQSTFNAHPAGLFLVNLQTKAAQLETGEGVDTYVTMSDDGRFLSYQENGTLTTFLLDTVSGAKAAVDGTLVPGFPDAAQAPTQIIGMSNDAQKLLVHGMQRQSDGSVREGDFFFDRAANAVSELMPSDPLAADPLIYRTGFLTSDASAITYPCGATSFDQALCIQPVPGTPGEPVCEK
jgi:hypothetical protein